MARRTDGRGAGGLSSGPDRVEKSCELSHILRLQPLLRLGDDALRQADQSFDKGPRDRRHESGVCSVDSGRGVAVFLAITATVPSGRIIRSSVPSAFVSNR